MEPKNYSDFCTIIVSGSNLNYSSIWFVIELGMALALGNNSNFPRIDKGKTTAFRGLKISTSYILDHLGNLDVNVTSHKTHNWQIHVV